MWGGRHLTTWPRGVGLELAGRADPRGRRGRLAVRAAARALRAGAGRCEPVQLRRAGGTYMYMYTSWRKSYWSMCVFFTSWATSICLLTPLVFSSFSVSSYFYFFFFYSLVVMLLLEHIFETIYMGSVLRRWGAVRPLEDLALTKA